MTSKKALEIVARAEAVVASGNSTWAQLESTVMELVDLLKQAIEAITAMQEEYALLRLQMLFQSMGIDLNDLLQPPLDTEGESF
jgi:hypothetical protein